jgi:hypothetical protein
MSPNPKELDLVIIQLDAEAGALMRAGLAGCDRQRFG